MYTTIARWYCKEGCVDEAKAALEALAARVHDEEESTLGYLVHTAGAGALPPTNPNEIVFVEIYANQQAFLDHVNGVAFQSFLKASGSLFVAMAPPNSDQAFFLASPIDRFAGFLRSDAG